MNTFSWSPLVASHLPPICKGDCLVYGTHDDGNDSPDDVRRDRVELLLDDALLRVDRTDDGLRANSGQIFPGQYVMTNRRHNLRE